MRRKFVRWCSLGPGLAIAGLGAAATGWACVPQPLVALLPRASGPPGSRIIVQALAVSGVQEVRWNSVEGTKLADAIGPSFSVEVTIPDVAEGLYSVVVLERRPDSSVGSTGRAAFLVTSAQDESSGEPAAARTSTTVAGTQRASSRNESAWAGVGGLVAGSAVLLGTGAAAGAWLARRAHARANRREPPPS